MPDNLNVQYLADGESFQEGTFSWLVCTEPAFCAPLRSIVIHRTNPQRLDLIVDISGRVKTPPMTYRSKLALRGISGNLHQVIENMAAEDVGHTYRVLIHDDPAKTETWRRLELSATIGPVQFKRSVDLPEDARKAAERDGFVSDEAAIFTLTAVGRIQKLGDWTRPPVDLLPLDPFVQQLRDKAARELAAQDAAERTAKAAKSAVNLAKDIAVGGIELIANIHKEAQNSERERKALEARSGSFYTTKLLQEIYQDIWTILQKPIGEFRFSVDGDTATPEITALCRWVEDIPAFPNAVRELTCHLRFDPTEAGTTIRYDHTLYEVPPGSIYANLLVRTVNGWVKALCEQRPGP